MDSASIQIKSGSSIFSEEEAISLSDIRLPQLTLSQELIQIYFETSTPYLINLALCLLCKCISKGVIELKQNNVGWLLGISTVVSYKVYYDETIEGLMQFFGQTMGLTAQELARLERWFLGAVNYELVVSSVQYQSMMKQLLS